nr:hypothetical protein [Escherichia coli]EFG4523273.1 hypothetical protein [Escherichia coli]EFG8477262.1 hypothetical protein [Escherichia coli]EFG9909955.1 hypothetical protein [Escherichia coli]EFJ9452619.1 hypothetical protein [Escherichia coli]
MNSSFVGSISISCPIAILASVSSAAKHKTAHAPIVLKRTAIGCGFTEFALARKSQIALHEIPYITSNKWFAA